MHQAVRNFSWLAHYIGYTPGPTMVSVLFNQAQAPRPMRHPPAAPPIGRDLDADLHFPTGQPQRGPRLQGPPEPAGSVCPQVLNPPGHSAGC